jgi:primary-amine oxidase
MPVEKVSVMLKPDGFFTKNPALDVPASVQSFNKSTLHQDAPASCCDHQTGGSSADKAKLYKRVD